MDTPINYPAQIPLDTDVSILARATVRESGEILSMVYGTATATGLGASPGAGLTVSIAAGSLAQPSALAPLASGSLPASTTPCYQHGINNGVSSVALGGTGVWTIYANVLVAYANQQVLPFYNSANPNQTFAGENNSNAELPTQIQATVEFGATQGAVPGGSVALYVVTVPAGATSITQAMIAQSGGIFWQTLPQLQAAIALLAPKDSPVFTTKANFLYGPNNGYGYNMQTDGTTVWYYTNTAVTPNATVNLFSVNSGGPTAIQTFTAMADIDAQKDLVLTGNLGAFLGISQAGPANNKYQWTGDLLSGTNPARSKTNGVYLSNGLNAYAVAGAPVYLGTGVDAGNIVDFVGNGAQGTIGSIATNTGQTGVLYNTTSDRRLKENISGAEAEAAVSRLMALKPSIFSMIHDPAKQIIPGFIADEFGEVYPHATTGTPDATVVDEDGVVHIIPMQIDKTHTIPDLVRTVQFLFEQNQSLRRELDELKALVMAKIS